MSDAMKTELLQPGQDSAEIGVGGGEGCFYL